MAKNTELTPNDVLDLVGEMLGELDGKIAALREEMAALRRELQTTSRIAAARLDKLETGDKQPVRIRTA